MTAHPDHRPSWASSVDPAIEAARQARAVYLSGLPAAGLKALLRLSPGRSLWLEAPPAPLAPRR